MKNLLFLFQYILRPRTVGAIMPSSRFLASKMLEDINFENASVIVEYGPGTGIFTEQLLKKRLPNIKIILMEKNQEFYNHLINKFGHRKNLFIINDGAENIVKYLAELEVFNVDYVISGLPFASLPKRISKSILTSTKRVLNDEGKFITFQYTQRKMSFINHYFEKMHIKREIRNFPPAYVLSCNNERSI
ncbi:class I SAM-dependent methyltransferase [Gottfriedia sp. NPDC056225]|uniref:class I SAM-dependent methyltransferase n=1 Tax=Gottfriedia sp. NPDC056225 TaxID=3345751 RepID=UPI0035D628D5